MSKVLFIAHYAESLMNFRGELIKSIQNREHNVIALAPESNYKQKIEKELGIKYESIVLDRTGSNPYRDLKTIKDIYNKIRKYKPDYIFSYAIKPVIYGGIAAKIAGDINIYSLIPGAGVMFTGDNKNSLFTKIVAKLYRFGMSNNKAIFFQNPDDRDLFKSKDIITSNSQVYLVNGSGVDTEYYSPAEPVTDNISFLLMGRILKDKGVYEYISAAKKLKNKYDNIQFNLLGPFDSNPSAISKKEVMNWDKNGHINYLGKVDDVRPFIAENSVFVLPSYREGTPRSVLEAMSMRKPIITTDAPGCRETVIDGENGFMVPVKDSNSLANAMEGFIKEPELIKKMGQRSREIALEKYDVHKVNQFIIDKMGL